ncbi:1,4-dihydroxy-2-naphthoate octaprenyltransferase [Psychroserpens ponticola]|uniref:1,4-dihydroxy-2-naphthoate octaprenyltransferase n=1 Tax=Psychroserpens ponticola TaxID=2932268 RepID=A0ABY7S4K9_9FLAO|nr:1,4-dihydroxy-2-naphthoate octaprenyltransferase [Psychroserpens ponticola]WCO03346.1 1,4-dihydroxy-2-naphthoate octaprenyltransferase [Psychroserpens ponticola]
MFKKIKPWISAFRLRTLPLSVSGIIIGACLAEHNGAFNIYVFIIAILLTISLQILSNLANDYGDGVKGTDNENRVGPERAIQSGAISEHEMMLGIKNNILIVVGLSVALIYTSFGVSHLFLSLLFFLLAGLSIYAAITYTVGDSAYGYRGLGDIFVFIFFGFVSVGGSYLLFVQHLDHHIFLPAIALGLLSAGVLNLNNMRDIDSDKSSNKMTLAVKLGKTRAKQYHLLLISSAIIVSVIFAVLYFSSFYNLLFFIAYVPLTIHIIKISKAKEPNDYDSQLKVLALTTFLFSILLGVGYIL